MSDGREKQPNFQSVDLTRETTGGNIYHAGLETWTYFSIRNEDVFSRAIEVNFRAEDIRGAMGFAQSIRTIIGMMHDVHKCRVTFVAEADELIRRQPNQERQS